MISFVLCRLECAAVDFFFKQESLTFIQWVFRGIVAFFFLLIVTKLMGQRSISQLRLLDFMMALLLGNMLAHPLSDESLGMSGSMITMSVLLLLYILALFVSSKWRVWREFLEPAPLPLIKNGQILYPNLAKAKITLEFLLSELRREQVDDIQKVAVALWEPSGTLSVFLQSQHQTVTASDLKLTTKPFTLPAAVIKEGKIDPKQLAQVGKNEAWLQYKLQASNHKDLDAILLATLDHQEHLTVYEKDQQSV